MIWLEDRSDETGEIYLYVSSPDSLQKCIEWLSKQLNEAKRLNKQSFSIFDFKKDDWLKELEKRDKEREDSGGG